MSQIAKLKLFDRQTKNMFLTCLKSLTLLNEYVEKDKIIHNNTAQLMLRDKLKFFASKTGTAAGKKKRLIQTLSLNWLTGQVKLIIPVTL